MSISTETIEQLPVPDHVPAHRIHDIDIYNFVGEDDDYHHAIKRYQGADIPGLIWTPRNGGHWIATGGEIIRNIMDDTEKFSSRLIIIPKAASEEYNLIPTSLDPPEHGPVRQILDKVVNLRQVRNLESRIRDIAIELIEPWVDKGRMDFSTFYAEAFPVQVFMAIMDLPMKDAPMLKHYTTEILRPPGKTPGEKADAMRAAINGFYEYAGKVLDERSGRMDGDGVSIVANSQIDGSDIDRKTALGLIANLLLGGLDTVISFVGFAMLFLARNPAHARLLAENPAMIPRSVEELFRRFPIASAGRVVAHDVEYDGTLLREGDMIQVPTALCGLDEAFNDDPMRVDFSRPRPLHNTFGVGRHRCAGLYLARTEITVTLQEWLKRIPAFSVVDGMKPEYRTGMVALVENIHLEWKVAQR